MTLEQMRFFIEVARQGSFTVAAERIGVTQSAVSASIKKLEGTLGVSLFIRSARQLMLTENGEIILKEVQRIIYDIELISRRIECKLGAGGKKLLIACTSNPYDYWMPGLVELLKDRKDLPRIDLIRGQADEVTAWVMRGTVDAGVTEFMPSHPAFQHIGIFQDRLILCASHPIACRVHQQLSWNDLYMHRPVIWEKTDITAIIENQLTKNGVNTSSVEHKFFHLPNTAAVLCALKSGKSLGFVPERAAEPSIAMNALSRIGEIEIPLNYWIFSRKETEIKSISIALSEAARS